MYSARVEAASAGTAYTAMAVIATSDTTHSLVLRFRILNSLLVRYPNWLPCGAVTHRTGLAIEIFPSLPGSAGGRNPPPMLLGNGKRSGTEVAGRRQRHDRRGRLRGPRG